MFTEMELNLSGNLDLGYSEPIGKKRTCHSQKNTSASALL